jgi:hypothetical protein
MCTLAYINSDKHSAQYIAGVILDFLYCNFAEALLQYFEDSSILGRILCHWVSGWQRFKYSGKDSVSLGEWLAEVQESSSPGCMLDSPDECAALPQNMGNCLPNNSVTSKKTLVLSTNAVRTSNLTSKYFLVLEIPQMLV